MINVDSIRRERNSKTVPLARFYSEYKSNSTIFYGFVEGKDDPSYYRSIINSYLPEQCSIILYPCDGKKNVRYIFDQIRSKNFKKSKITYFLDRDISDFVNDKNIINDEYVYVTDNYSIENDFLSSDTFINIFRDLLGYSFIPECEMRELGKQFELQRKKFEELMLPIMATIIFWKRGAFGNPMYGDVNIDSMFEIVNGVVGFKLPVCEILEKFYEKCKVPYEIHNSVAIESIINEIKAKSSPRKILRGKYLSSFFVTSCNYLHETNKGVLKVKNKTKINVGDIWTKVAPRSRPPLSLKRFVQNKIGLDK